MTAKGYDRKGAFHHATAEVTFNNKVRWFTGQCHCGWAGLPVAHESSALAHAEQHVRETVVPSLPVGPVHR